MRRRNKRGDDRSRSPKKCCAAVSGFMPERKARSNKSLLSYPFTICFDIFGSLFFGLCLDDLHLSSFQSSSTTAYKSEGEILVRWIDETTLTPTKSSSGHLIAVKWLNPEVFKVTENGWYTCF